MDPTRLLPLLLTIGGAGVAVRGGSDVVDRVVDTVKVVLVRAELQQIGKVLEANAILGERLPRDREALAKLLREEMRHSGGRDPALDLWQSPYELGVAERRRVIRSLGPNRGRDSCARAAATDAASPAAAQIELPVMTADDVCVPLELSAGKGRDGADPILGADSPFRRMRGD